MSKVNLLTATIALTSILSACSSGGESQDSRVQAADGIEAIVTDFELRASETSSMRIEAWVIGFFTNTCARINNVTELRDGNDILITMATARTAAEGCELEQRAEFLQIIDLDVSDLKAGEYTVKVGGFSDTFELSEEDLAQ